MPIKRIVVGVTENETSQHAARTALEYAEATGATLHVVTAVRHAESDVIEIGGDRWEFSTIDQAQANVNRFVDSLKASVQHTVVALNGDPAEVLVSEAERVGADLIVVGNVRMQGPARVLGSVGSHVLRHAPCDVLVVKTV
jgi:nucleotide-binding universal stress UspA family protein